MSSKGEALGPVRCMAKNERGERCAAYAMAGSPYCFWHNPDAAEARRAARARGGRNRKRTAGPGADPVETVNDAAEVLGVEIAAVLDTTFPSLSRLRAVAYAVATFCKVLEVGEFERRLARLEGVAFGGGEDDDGLQV